MFMDIFVTDWRGLLIFQILRCNVIEVAIKIPPCFIYYMYDSKLHVWSRSGPKVLKLF